MKYAKFFTIALVLICISFFLAPDVSAAGIYSNRISYKSLKTTAMDMAINGNYAYVVEGNQSDTTAAYLEIFDISDPKNPIKKNLVTNTNFSGGAWGVFWGSISISGSKAYVMWSNTSKTLLSVYDISDPENPNLLSDFSGLNANAAAGMSMYGSYLFIYTSAGLQGLNIVNVSNPASIFIEKKISNLGGGATAISGNYLYMGNMEFVTTATYYFSIYNISTPTAPVLVGRTAITGVSATLTGLTVSGNYAYAGSVQNPDNFHIFDISNKANPVRVSGNSYPIGGSYNLHMLAVDGNYVYAPYDGSVYNIFDVSNRANPLLVGSGPMTGYGIRALAYGGKYAVIASGWGGGGGGGYLNIYTEPVPVITNLSASPNPVQAGSSAIVTVTSTNTSFCDLYLLNPVPDGIHVQGSTGAPNVSLSVSTGVLDYPLLSFGISAVCRDSSGVSTGVTSSQVNVTYTSLTLGFQYLGYNIGGTVTSAPVGTTGGINCSGMIDAGGTISSINNSPGSLSCMSDHYHKNTAPVTITAKPNVGSIFLGWSGNADCTDGSMTMDASKSCTAKWGPATTVNGVCGATAETCTSGTYSNSPADTATNYQWTCLGSGLPIGTNSGTCTAPITYTLTVNKNGTGSGTVTGAGTYNSGTLVTATASASGGSTFAGWSGDCNASGQVTMTSNKTCTATFNVITYTLTVNKNGTGSGTVTGAGTYNSGTLVTATASASGGSTFAGWSGDCNASGQVTMTSNKTCTATFTLLDNNCEAITSECTQCWNNIEWVDGTVSCGTSCAGPICAVDNGCAAATSICEICYNGYIWVDGTLNTPPTVSNMTAPNWSYSDARQYGALNARLNWTFSDPDTCQSENAYQLIVNTSDSIVSPLFNSDKCFGYNDPISKCIIDAGIGRFLMDSTLLSYNTSYYWWIRVWDNDDDASVLTQYNTAQDTPVEADDGNPLTFTTYKHKFPIANPTCIPQKPSQGEKVKCTANSQRFFSSDPELPKDCDKNICDWLWTVPSDASIDNPATSTPTVIFNSGGLKTIILRVTDETDTGVPPYFSEFPLDINVNAGLPNWEEVKPE